MKLCSIDRGSLFSALASDAESMARLQAGMPDKHHVRINRLGHLHHGQTGYVDMVDGHESRVVIEDCVRSWQPSVCLVDMGEES